MILLAEILASANVPEVIFEAAKLGILASANVPEVIFEAAKLGISDADKESLADGTVPLPKFEALSDERLAPLPKKLPAWKLATELVFTVSELAVSVVVNTVNLSALSSHTKPALFPVLPLSNINPISFEFAPVKPEFNSIIESEIVVFVLFTVVVVPLTVKFPATVKSFTFVISLLFRFKSVAIRTLLPDAPRVTVTPLVPLISPSCSNTISILFVPSPTKISAVVSPMDISPPGFVIVKLPLLSVSIFASTFADESLNSIFRDAGVINTSLLI